LFICVCFSRPQTLL